MKTKLKKIHIKNNWQINVSLLKYFNLLINIELSQTEIERENKILADKVIKIIKRPPPEHMRHYNNLIVEWTP